MKRITGKKTTECGLCEGVGYTPATAAEVEVTTGTNDQGEEQKKFRTTALGSGCPRCHGTGQLT